MSSTVHIALDSHRRTSLLGVGQWPAPLITLGCDGTTEALTELLAEFDVAEQPILDVEVPLLVTGTVTVAAQDPDALASAINDADLAGVRAVAI